MEGIAAVIEFREVHAHVDDDMVLREGRALVIYDEDRGVIVTGCQLIVLLQPCKVLLAVGIAGNELTVHDIVDGIGCLEAGFELAQIDTVDALFTELLLRLFIQGVHRLPDRGHIQIGLDGIGLVRFDVLVSCGVELRIRGVIFLDRHVSLYKEIVGVHAADGLILSGLYCDSAGKVRADGRCGLILRGLLRVYMIGNTEIRAFGRRLCALCRCGGL